MNRINEDDKEKIKKWYTDKNGGAKEDFRLDDLSVILGRTKSFICRLARSMGLTSMYRPMGDVKKNAFREAIKKGRDINGHPKGMLGKTHSKKFSSEMSARVTLMWKDPNSKINDNEHRQAKSDRMSKQMVNQMKNNPTSAYSRTHKGWVDFPSGKRYFFRSGWEMNYAHYLEWLVSVGEIENWEYEVDTFWFENIRRGVRSYTPDFKVFNKDKTFEYHEVKGWMDSKSATKLKRIAKYYPEIKVILIDEGQYKSIMKQSGLFLR